MTAGVAIDDRIDELMAADDPVVALLLDTAGWLAIESITRQFSERLKRTASRQACGSPGGWGRDIRTAWGARWLRGGSRSRRGCFGCSARTPPRSPCSRAVRCFRRCRRSGLYGLRARRHRSHGGVKSARIGRHWRGAATEVRVKSRGHAAGAAVPTNHRINSRRRDTHAEADPRPSERPHHHHRRELQRHAQDQGHEPARAGSRRPDRRRLHRPRRDPEAPRLHRRHPR